LLFLGIFIFTPFSQASAALQNKGTDSYLAGLWHVYAPDIIEYKGKRIMFSGGWLTKSATGDDVIYYSEASGNNWSKPIKVFEKNGYAVNDPTVIKHPTQDWLFMYYTALPKSAQGGHEEMTSRNVIGFASSVNGGKSWTDHGIMVVQNNGYNNDGAWAPSVVLSPDQKEFWVYYHTNSPSNIILRSRLKLNGWEPAGITQRVEFRQQTAKGMIKHPLQKGRVNIDVDYTKAGELGMVTNEFSLSQIGFYTSDPSGLIFTESSNIKNPIVSAGDNQVLTPALEVKNDRNFNVFFGFGTRNNPCSEEWIKAGVPGMRCSNSIHGWKFQR